EHASARIERGGAEPVAAFPTALLDAASMAPADFYKGCQARGLIYGPAFQGISSLYVSKDAALGEVRLPDSCRATPTDLHAALWDAALQVSLALCPGGETVVPTAVARVAVLGSLEGAHSALWSYVERRDETRFDLTFYDAERKPLLCMAGLTLEKLSTKQEVAVDLQRVHQLRFQKAERPTTREAVQWLVVGEPTEAAALSSALSAQGASSTLVPGFAASALAWQERLRRGGEVKAIAFVAPLDASTAQHRDALLSLAGLVSACGKLPAPPRLAVITHAAQAVLEDEPVVAGGGLYWGFTRVLRREHAELSPVLIDLGQGAVAQCAAELIASDGEDQVALRGDARFVARLVRGEVEQPAERAPWSVPAQPFQLKAVRPGFWDGLEFRPLARLTPAAGEVEVEVASAALNFIDVMKAMGTYPGVEGRAAMLGGELAGRVVAVGEGVTELRVGDRVAGCAFGAFASHVTLRAEHVKQTPRWLSDEQAAALPLVMMTAWYGLKDLAQLTRGESVLIHSATGGLGLAAIQVAKLCGAQVIATAGSEDKRRYLRELGIEHVFDSRSLAWAEQVRRVTGGRGVDVVLNSLTGAAIRLGLDVLAEDGRFIEVGKKDIYGGRSLSLEAFKKGISFAAVDLAGLMERRPVRFAKLFADVWAALSAEQLAPLPVIPYAFGSAAEALRAMS
ncbi:MAG TPA: zinc-binding dehydrogenase, partial [Polyangiales bacterium]